MKTLKTNFKLLLSLILVFGVLLSCNPDDDNNNSGDPGNDPEESLIDFGSSIQRDFMGRIVDESNLPVESVVVTIGTKTATTDANGVFMINDANVKERQAYIIAEKSGYLKGMRTVVPTDGANQIRMMLIPENLVSTIVSGTSSEVNLPNGTKVTFDGSFKDENGNAYTGNVDVLMYHLEASNQYIEDIMPGNLQAVNEAGDERVLESYGMLNVELRGDSGEKLNIADGHVAQIELLVDAAQSGVAPATIPLWHFDEDNGYWVEDGEATLVGGKYIGEVSHFSWWNCDAQFPTVDLCMTVVDASNVPLSNVRVELWRSGATYGRVGYSNGNGEICGLIPANEVLTLKAIDQCGLQVYNTTIGPFTTSINNINTVLSGVSTTTISGNLVDCSNANVTNGYVIMDYGIERASVLITNGSFSFTVLDCSSLLTFELEGVDYDAFQTTTILLFNISTPNVGTIIACNAITEFITLQVDSDPVKYYLSNIVADENQQGNGFSIISQGAGPNGWFSVATGGIVPGTYLMNFAVGSFGLEAEIDLNYNIANTLQFNLISYGAVGQYINATITGTYTDYSNTVRNLSVNIHVLRDN